MVKGASEGQGLGNAFLSHIKAVDGIFHLLRAFDDPDVIHVEGELDPLRDIQIIHEELRLKDEGGTLFLCYHAIMGAVHQRCSHQANYRIREQAR